MKTLCHCAHCKNFIEEPEVRGAGNPHARNICPFCGAELNDKYTDYVCELVTDSFYEHISKLPCHPNYLH